MAPATVGLIFVAMRFVDAFRDILIGSVIDRTNTRMGKFRPHIMVFCVPLVLSAVLAFSPAGLRGTNGALIWAVVTCFLLGSVFYTLVNILTPRSRASTWPQARPPPRSSCWPRFWCSPTR
ncbi:MAG: MFS transporter [Kocuria palustris]|nr:MFS transporter [Kocuria palustris]